MAMIRFTRFWAVRGWMALLAVLLLVGRRVGEWSHISHSNPLSVSRWDGIDGIDASMLILFAQPPAAPGGGASGLSDFGLRQRRMRGAILQ